MNITIFGAGHMGHAIGTRLVTGGHSVTLVNRTPEKAKTVAAELQSLAKNGAMVKTATADSVELGEVVVLAVKYSVSQELVRQLGNKLVGKVVVDISNPLNATYSDLATAPGTSAAEELAKAAPAGAQVVKAFNTVFAGTLVNGQVGGVPLDIFIAGDDEAAKGKVSQLVKDGGMMVVDVGPLSRARQLESLAFLGIDLKMKQFRDLSIGWKLIRAK